MTTLNSTLKSMAHVLSDAHVINAMSDELCEAHADKYPDSVLEFVNVTMPKTLKYMHDCIYENMKENPFVKYTKLYPHCVVECWDLDSITITIDDLYATFNRARGKGICCDISQYNVYINDKSFDKVVVVLVLEQLRPLLENKGYKLIRRTNCNVIDTINFGMFDYDYYELHWG